MTWINRILTCGFLILISVTASAQDACCEIKVPAGLAAQWVPSPGVVDKMRKTCGGKLDAPGSRCLLEWVTQDNAAYDAMVFTRSIGVRGYLRDYRHEGVVGVAYVVFPGARADGYGIFLVNGDPFRFDPDDPNLPSPEGLQQNMRYRSLVEQYGPLTLVPGNRRNRQQPLVMPGIQGGQRFLFVYSLRSSKGGATLSDSALVWVYFNASGKFTGRELESIGDAE